MQDLRIDAVGITTLKVAGGGGEGQRLGIAARQNFQSYGQGEFNHLPYQGVLDLRAGIDPGKWNFVLYVQTVDNSDKSAAPIEAAQSIAGVVTSANIAVNGCTAVLLLDHVFDVI
ncbi:MAG: hypothetical protein ACR2RA_09455 [Geminicoccaceae bacterium]